MATGRLGIPGGKGLGTHTLALFFSLFPSKLPRILSPFFFTCPFLTCPYETEAMLPVHNNLLNNKADGL